VAQICTGYKLLLLDSVFPEEDGQVGFDELIVQFDVTDNAIANEVSTDSVVTKVFLGED